MSFDNYRSGNGKIARPTVPCSKVLLLIVLALIVIPHGSAIAQSPPGPDFSRLHDALGLRPEQERAWQSFQNAMQAGSQDMEGRRQAYENMDRLHAPERIDLAVQMMRTDLQQLERRADAMKAFYATLSPAQKQMFDRETLPPAGARNE